MMPRVNAVRNRHVERKVPKGKTKQNLTAPASVISWTLVASELRAWGVIAPVRPPRPGLRFGQPFTVSFTLSIVWTWMLALWW